MAKFYPAPVDIDAELSATAPLDFTEAVLSIDLSDYYTSSEADTAISTAETNANNYTDSQLANVPHPFSMLGGM